MARRNGARRARIDVTPARSRSRSRSRSGKLSGAVVRVGNRTSERFQSGGMLRPAMDLAAPTLRKNVVFSQAFSGRRRRNRKNTGRVGQYLPPIVSAYVDPWDEDAPGVRYPDPFRGLSGTYSGTFVGNVSSGGTYTDLNLSNVTPQAGTTLFFVTPDPSNILVQGLCGTNGSGFFTGVPAIFNWPNGGSYTNSSNSPNAFGPGTGMLNQDYTIGNLNGLRQLYSSGRLVAGGIKITSTMNFSTVSGTIHMAPVAYNLSRMTSIQTTNIVGGTTTPTAIEQLNGWQPALPNSLGAMCELPGYV
jgi:hypothetical protein